MPELSKHFFQRVNNDGLLQAFLKTWDYLSVSFLLLFQRLRARDPFIIKEINGSKMKLDVRLTGPNKLERLLALKGIREIGSTRKFQELLEDIKSENSTYVFDVGANVGYYALLEAQILGNQCQVVAIEAEPKNAERLRENIELNNYSQISVRQVAAGAERSTQELLVREKSNTHKMTELAAEKDSEQTTEVEVYPLDMIIEEEKIPSTAPIIIRMDIEGFEHRAFEGLMETLSSSNPMYVVVEIHDREHNPRDYIIQALEDNNFEPDFVSIDGGETIQGISSFEEIPRYGNVHLFAGRDIDISNA